MLGYFKQPRTLILAVVEANLDPQKQSVLTIAKEVDPTGERTFGIITKPDLVESPSGLEDFWVKKAQNGADSIAEVNFAKAWHVLRNRGVRETGNETSTAERDEAERMFFMSPERKWSQVDQAYWGIESLQNLRVWRTFSCGDPFCSITVLPFQGDMSISAALRARGRGW